MTRLVCGFFFKLFLNLGLSGLPWFTFIKAQVLEVPCSTTGADGVFGRACAAVSVLLLPTARTAVSWYSDLLQVRLIGRDAFHCLAGGVDGALGPLGCFPGSGDSEGLF